MKIVTRNIGTARCSERVCETPRACEFLRCSNLPSTLHAHERQLHLASASSLLHRSLNELLTGPFALPALSAVVGTAGP